MHANVWLLLNLPIIVCAGTPTHHVIDAATVEKWSSAFRNWHYYPGFVMPPMPDDGFQFESVDCPLVWRRGDEYVMWYTGFEGRGYQTVSATSKNLVDWTPEGLVMGYGEAGAFDHGGVTFGGLLFESYALDAPRVPKKWQGRYWALYGCYPRQGGYELRPGAQGLAWSEDLKTWHRHSVTRPALSIEGAAEWEKDCIYQPWLLEHEGKFWDFYNAANGSVEQMGVATSTDLVHWERHADNPIVRNGAPDSYNEQFCSDGKVFRDGDHWVMFYFGVGKGGAHVMVAYSNDLIHWTQDPTPLYKAGGHPAGLDSQYAHKVSIIYEPSREMYFMFYGVTGGQGRGIGLLTNKPLIDSR